MKKLAQPCWFASSYLLAAPLLAVTVLLSSCANSQPVVDNSAYLPENQRVSTVPWAKPQGWENNSPLGALGNDPRFSGSR